MNKKLEEIFTALNRSFNLTLNLYINQLVGYCINILNIVDTALLNWVGF